jgi:hypothetical protein
MSDRRDAFDAASFSPHIGGEFQLSAASGTVPLVLAVVELGPEQPGAPREQPFTLDFRVLHGQAVPQGTYVLSHTELGEMDVFLVPRQPAGDGLPRLEALFN